MQNFSRRRFISYSGGLLGLGFVPGKISVTPSAPKLSFSTLGCPDWSWQQILDFASSHGYQGIEIRGLQRELNLARTPQFADKKSIAATRASLKDKNLSLVVLGASAGMHHRDKKDRQAAMDEAKRFIDIAELAGCPQVRVFPDKLPKEFSKESTLEIISSALSSLGNYARGSKVHIVMETHGDLVWADDLVKVMQNVSAPDSVGLVWDISNMWSVTGEPPAAVFPKLEKWIRHTHLKDLKKIGDQHQYTLLGQGEVPVFAAVDLLTASGYKGFFSFEWEKLWHPEIDGPEISLPQYAEAMKKHFNADLKKQND